METIWLQRPSYDVPWGFRLMGGAEYAQALQVQRVTPGSIAATGLHQGDVIFKIGDTETTNLTHAQSMEVIKNSGNMLQLSVKKAPSSQLSPQASPQSYNYSPQQQQSYTPQSQNDSYTRDMNRLNIGEPGYNQQDSNMQYTSPNSYGSTGSSPYSQSQNEQQSYAYSPNSSYQSHGDQHNSYEYSPSSQQQQQPHYPTSPGAHAYKPVNPYQATSPKPFSPSGGYESQSPTPYAYQPHTPTNQMSSPDYPTGTPQQYQPTTPTYQPTTPTYQPSQPSYNPTQS
ncbi:unnamed protein product [Owenia fusiformis]|uniref:PDZ domain-containing protein n=1 Tax=Owenia fusiformis TaxID=6347 RepID=A0A8S4PKL0_OWEFU|nr:unnamed protein product [Owenia fusiformis]